MRKHTLCYRKNYPRPQFTREKWINLNGTWDFLFDENGDGDVKGYADGFASGQKIFVPYAYQCAASGIGCETLCKNIWYQKIVRLDSHAGRILLHLEGCDYRSYVYVNGKFCGEDIGGYHRQTFDITEACVKGDNLLVIKAYDDYSKEQPRGKQRWENGNYGCWYVDVSGLYKTVWIEEVADSYITDVKITPSLQDASVKFQFTSFDAEGMNLSVKAAYDGETVAEGAAEVKNGVCEISLSVADNLHLWSVGEGSLYDTEYRLSRNGKIYDVAYGYFGMRNISVKDGQVTLNGKPLYQRLILDQGYWKDCALTPPNEEALEKDIVDAVSLGFNGARKHQKVEDERYLYYADIYGYLVWAEMPSMYSFTEASCEAFSREWQLAVKQQYNHPSVACWVIFNESWGVENVLTDRKQQEFVDEMYGLTKRYDAMRPIVSNDGWEHTTSDIITIHHYSQDAATLIRAFDEVDKCVADKYYDHDRRAFADGYGYEGQPILITEFGGTSFVKDTVGDNWGYGEGVKTDEEYVARLRSLVEAISSLKHIQGFCYTQLSDVYQEVNGLVKFDRTPKERAKTICGIIGKRR